MNPQEDYELGMALFKIIEELPIGHKVPWNFVIEQASLQPIEQHNIVERACSMLLFLTGDWLKISKIVFCDKYWNQIPIKDLEDTSKYKTTYIWIERI